MANAVLEVKNLTKYYKKTKGVENLDFKIDAKEIVGFIGPNGSGKSTTIKAILNLIIKDRGSVEIFGKDLEKNHKEIMRYVGYCPSYPSFFETMVARKFFSFSNSLYEEDYTENYISLAKEMKLNLDQKINEMSEGNQKKVMLINALFHNPKFILLDEPTSTLDPGTSAVLFNILRNLRDRGSAVLFSSHNLSDIQKTCDRVIILKEGGKIKDLAIKDLRFAHKRIHLITEKEFDFNNYQLSGMKDIKKRGNSVDFLFVGNVNDLIKKLNKDKVLDITIENPTLDEIFMHFYTD